MLESDQHSFLLNKLREQSIIKTPKVYDILFSIDRALFTQRSTQYAYEDTPLNITHSISIASPHMYAHILEALKSFLTPGSKVLDVGCGGGYFCVCMSKMMEDEGQVYGIEDTQEAVSLSLDKIRKNYSELLDSSLITILQRDLKKGLPEFGPYQVIYVPYCYSELPSHLIDQLDRGGRMVICLGDTHGKDIFLIDKDLSGNIMKSKLPGMTFIPIVHKEEIWEGP